MDTGRLQQRSYMQLKLFTSQNERKMHENMPGIGFITPQPILGKESMETIHIQKNEVNTIVNYLTP